MNTAETQKFVLKVRRVCAQTLVHKDLLEHAEISVRDDIADMTGRNLAVQMNLFIAEGRTNTITKLHYVPASWWQHAKYSLKSHGWLPEWTPVRFTRLTAHTDQIYVCPHKGLNPDAPAHIYHLFDDEMEIPHDEDS